MEIWDVQYVFIDGWLAMYLAVKQMEAPCVLCNHVFSLCRHVRHIACILTAFYQLDKIDRIDQAAMEN